MSPFIAIEMATAWTELMFRNLLLPPFRFLFSKGAYEEAYSVPKDGSSKTALKFGFHLK